MTFGERLQAVLDAQGINRAELCRRTGLKSANLVPYMKPGSDRSPKLSTAVLIANALGVSLDYLAGRSDNPSLQHNVDEDPNTGIEGDGKKMRVLQSKGSDVSMLVDDFEQCTPDRQRMLSSIARDLRDQSKEIGVDSKPSKKAVNE